MEKLLTKRITLKFKEETFLKDLEKYSPFIDMIEVLKREIALCKKIEERVKKGE